MVKAQVFLRGDQQKQLRAIAARTGRKQSELIRQGVDRVIEAEAKRDHDWKAGLMQARGMRKHRKDIPGLMRRLRADLRKRHKRFLDDTGRRRHFDCRRLSARQSLSAKPVLSVISVAELRAGTKSASEEHMLAGFVASCETVPIDLRIAEHAGDFLRRFRARFGLDIADAIVAATAESVHAQVATLNVRHFPMFPDLMRPY